MASCRLAMPGIYRDKWKYIGLNCELRYHDKIMHCLALLTLLYPMVCF